MAYSTRSPYMPERDPGRYSRNIMDLMLQRGDIEAQRAQNSGAVWGQAIQQLGGIAGQAIDQYGQQKQLEQAKAAEAEKITGYSQFLQGEWDGNPRTLLGKSLETFGPEIGERLTATVLEFSSLDKAQSPEEAAQQWARGLKLLEGLPEPLVAANYPLIARASAPILQGLGLDPGTIPQEYSPETLSAGLQLANNILGEKPEEAKTVVLGGDQRLARVGPGGEAEVVLDAAAPDPMETEKARLTNEKLQAEIQRLRASPEKPAPSLTEVDKIAQRWKTATADTREIKRQVALMEEGIKAAERGDLAAGSQAVLVTFQKILDPTSVVRESEYARSAAGQSAMARAEGVFDRLAKGGAGVPVSELKKFAELARDMAKVGSADYLRAEEARLGALADEFNIKRDLIFEDVDYSAGAGGALPSGIDPTNSYGASAGDQMQAPDGTLLQWNGSRWVRP